MARIECNSPSTRGYSVAAVGDGVCFIHAHGEGDANPDYDRFGSRVSHWIYMPINPGEYVEEIWVSNPRYDRLNKSAGLTVRIHPWQGRYTELTWRLLFHPVHYEPGQSYIFCPLGT